VVQWGTESHQMCGVKKWLQQTNKQKQVFSHRCGAFHILERDSPTRLKLCATQVRSSLMNYFKLLPYKVWLEASRVLHLCTWSWWSRCTPSARWCSHWAPPPPPPPPPPVVVAQSLHHSALLMTHTSLGNSTRLKRQTLQTVSTNYLIFIDSVFSVTEKKKMY